MTNNESVSRNFLLCACCGAPVVLFRPRKVAIDSSRLYLHAPGKEMNKANSQPMKLVVQTNITTRRIYIAVAYMEDLTSLYATMNILCIL